MAEALKKDNSELIESTENAKEFALLLIFFSIEVAEISIEAKKNKIRLLVSKYASKDKQTIADGNIKELLADYNKEIGSLPSNIESDLHSSCKNIAVTS